MGILSEEGHGGNIVGRKERFGRGKRVSAMSYVASLHEHGRFY